MPFGSRTAFDAEAARYRFIEKNSMPSAMITVSSGFAEAQGPGGERTFGDFSGIVSEGGLPRLAYSDTTMGSPQVFVVRGACH